MFVKRIFTGFLFNRYTHFWFPFQIVKLFMKCGERKKIISGPISVTDISKFTGGSNGDSVVSGPVCQPNTDRAAIGESELYWRFNRTKIPRSTTNDGYLSGWIAVIYPDEKKPNLALQRFHNQQVKEGIFTCFYKPEDGARLIDSVVVYFPSE